MEGKTQRMTIMPVKFILIISILVWLTQALAMAASLPNPIVCQETCGGIRIEFPFGIGKGCFMNESFEVTCNYSFSPPKPFITSINMELMTFLASGQVVVYNPVIQSDCGANSSNTTMVSLSGTPFVFSAVGNRFTAMGCNNYATLVQDGNTLGGCLSICRSESNTSGCYGLNCCQTTIPPNVQSFEANMTNPFSTEVGRSNECKSAFIVLENWLRSPDKVLGRDHVPAVLEWAEDQGNCDFSETRTPYINCTSKYCWAQVGVNQFCICSECQDASKCKANKCQLYCMYTPGGYSCPSCPNENYQYSYSKCYPSYLLNPGRKSKAKIIIIGCASGLGLMFLLIGLWLLYKLIKRRKAMKLKQKFFKKNGGLLLEQLSTKENNVEQTKLFASIELEKATDH